MKKKEEQQEEKKILVEVPDKFYRDENGHYWENRPIHGRRVNFMVPAPVWAGNINPYLFEGPNIFIEGYAKPLCKVQELRRGSDPVDGGFLTMTDEAKKELLKAEPQAEPFIRQYMNGKEFINDIPRWCLWFVGVEPADVRKCPRVLDRIKKCQEYRRTSKRAATKKAADTPMLFAERRICETNYLAIPKVSSGDRKYIPIGWLPPEVIPGDKLFSCDNATLFQFGILTSSVHMAWSRVLGQHLGAGFSYANTMNYNAFPWPYMRREIPWLPGGLNPQYVAIEKTAQAILDARKLYPRSTLADLYDERTMPPELRKAHKANDEAVMDAYGFERHYEDDRFHDEDITINLMYMYKDLTGCREFYESYPNLKFWESYYGAYDDDEDYEEEGEC